MPEARRLLDDMVHPPHCVCRDAWLDECTHCHDDPPPGHTCPRCGR